MRHRLAMLLLLALPWILVPPAQAAISAYEFDTPEQERRFNRLSQELRCLVCQNQNIADSNAGLAVDLRRQIHEMILAGQTDAEIIDFMILRYGDFVLYRPPVRGSTLMLWAGPFILLILSMAGLLWFIRRRVAVSAESDLSTAEQAQLDALQKRHGDLS